MVATTIDYQKLQDWRPKRLYCHFRLSVVVAVARVSFFKLGVSKTHICRWNNYCHSICHSSKDISISGFVGHFAIFCSQSLGDTSYSGSVWSKIPDMPLEFRRYMLQFQSYICFRFLTAISQFPVVVRY